MNIYLASGFRQRFMLRKLCDMIYSAGMAVTSSWIWIDERTERGQDDWDRFASQISQLNFNELGESNALIVDSRGIIDSNNGGVHTELGFALARGWPIVLVGERGNTFHWLPQIHQVSTYAEAVEALRGYYYKEYSYKGVAPISGKRKS